MWEMFYFLFFHTLFLRLYDRFRFRRPLLPQWPGNARVTSIKCWKKSVSNLDIYVQWNYHSEMKAARTAMKSWLASVMGSARHYGWWALGSTTLGLGSSEPSARPGHKGHTLWSHMREITKVVIEGGWGSAWARCVGAQEPSARGGRAFLGWGKCYVLVVWVLTWMYPFVRTHST